MFFDWPSDQLSNLNKGIELDPTECTALIRYISWRGQVQHNRINMYITIILGCAFACKKMDGSFGGIVGWEMKWYVVWCAMF